MGAFLVSTTNVHKDEVNGLAERLENECWVASELTSDEIIGLRSLINYVIANRVNDNASELSYTELLNLKMKLK